MSERTHDCGHDPGSLGCYAHCKCRCLPCRVEWSTYYRERCAGRTRTVDAADARTAVKRLSKWGWLHRDIADAVGVNQSTISRLASGTSGRTSRELDCQLVALVEEVGKYRRHVDAAPIIETVETLADGADVRTILPDDAIRRSYYRAVRSGRMTFAAADRLVTVGLGRPQLIDHLEPA